MSYRTFPLPGGREIGFDLPKDFTMKDLQRFLCHLVPFCADFEPPDPLTLLRLLGSGPRPAAVIPLRRRQHAVLW